METKRIVNVSGGAASAVALLRVVERFGRENVVARFANTMQESPDLYRFLGDVEKAAGVPIVRLEDGRNCWDVWLQELMFTNPSTGGCLAAWHLKKKLLAAHVCRIADPLEAIIYIGFGPDEGDRMDRLAISGSPWRFEFPLTWKPRLWRCDVLDELRQRGIEPTDAYEKGYPHDNCNRACILGGQGQWIKLYHDDPALFGHNAAQEQVFLARLAERGRKPRTILKDRRGGVTQNLSLVQLGEEIAAGIRGPDDGVEACSCMGDLFNP